MPNEALNKTCLMFATGGTFSRMVASDKLDHNGPHYFAVGYDDLSPLDAPCTIPRGCCTKYSPNGSYLTRED